MGLRPELRLRRSHQALVTLFLPGVNVTHYGDCEAGRDDGKARTEDTGPGRRHMVAKLYHDVTGEPETPPGLQRKIAAGVVIAAFRTHGLGVALVPDVFHDLVRANQIQEWHKPTADHPSRTEVGARHAQGRQIVVGAMLPEQKHDYCGNECDPAEKWRCAVEQQQGHLEVPARRLRNVRVVGT